MFCLCNKLVFLHRFHLFGRLSCLAQLKQPFFFKGRMRILMIIIIEVILYFMAGDQRDECSLWWMLTHCKFMFGTLWVLNQDAGQLQVVSSSFYFRSPFIELKKLEGCFINWSCPRDFVFIQLLLKKQCWECKDLSNHFVIFYIYIYGWVFMVISIFFYWWILLF